jgi:hypothetical protein
MTRRSITNSNVLSKTSGELNLIDTPKWAHVEALEAQIRPTLALPLDRIEAKRIAQQLGVHWVTVYRYRTTAFDARSMRTHWMWPLIPPASLALQTARCAS